MAHLHKVTGRPHGELTSFNCVIDGRWVLKITHFGVVSVYCIYNHFPMRMAEGKLSFSLNTDASPMR